MPKPLYINVLNDLKTDRSKQNLDIGLASQFPDTWEEFFCMLSANSGSKVVKLKPYPYQLTAIDIIENNRNTVILKSRQLGLSLIICSWILFNAIKNPAYKALVFSKAQNESADLGRRIRALLYSLGPKAPKLLSDSLFKMQIDGGGEINFLSSSVNKARGFDSVHTIFYDEAAFIPNFEDITKAAGPSQKMTGEDARTIFNSTPDAEAGIYYEKVKPFLDFDEVRDAFNTREFESLLEKTLKVEDTAFLCLHWSMHPVYSKVNDFKESTKKQLSFSESQFNQEFELSFAASEDLVFDPVMVDKACVLERSRQAKRGEGCEYFAGIDIAYKPGGDFFCCSILKITGKTIEVVDWYHSNNARVHEHRDNAIKLMAKYYPTLISIEMNGGYGYDLMEEVQGAFDNGVTRFYEFFASDKNKIIISDRLNYQLEAGTLKFVKGSPHQKDFKVFQKNGRKREAAEGGHDDAVMSIMAAFAPLVEDMDMEEHVQATMEEILYGSQDEYEHLMQQEY